jgi:hypothetical protein
MDELTTTSRPRYVISTDRGRRHLAVGTILEEVRRFDGWDHQGCIPSIRSTVAVLKVLTGPRAGETVEFVLESAYGDDPPIWEATWLEAVG